MSWCHRNGKHDEHEYTNGFGHRELCTGVAGPEDEEPEGEAPTRLVTDEDLGWLRRMWTPDEPTFRQWLAGSSKAHQIVDDMLAEREVVARARGPTYVEGGQD